MWYSSKTEAMWVRLSLLVVTVIQLTSSQSTYDVNQQDYYVSSCERNEQVFRQLAISNSQLHAAISQLMTAVYKLQEDVTELKTGRRQKNATGKLMD